MKRKVGKEPEGGTKNRKEVWNESKSQNKWFQFVQPKKQRFERIFKNSALRAYSRSSCMHLSTTYSSVTKCVRLRVHLAKLLGVRGHEIIPLVTPDILQNRSRDVPCSPQNSQRYMRMPHRGETDFFLKDSHQ